MFRPIRLVCFSVCLLLSVAAVAARNLVLLHTNDTHSAILPDNRGRGGVLQRKAVIDSVRAAEPNVILIDAGDIVQGSLFFNFFRGDVEYPLMDMLGYDYMILGNHEFDNGLQELAAHYRPLKATKLSSNYDFSDTPLADTFADFDIREIDGRRIGFFGINVDPAPLIADDNYRGMRFRPIIAEANRVARLLKHDLGCDLVVCVTHIGYSTRQGTDDLQLAAASEDIDIIIGAHSHTAVDPEDPTQHLIKNARGHDVLVTQTGKNGYNLGYINIDLDRLGDAADYHYRWIPVTDRFDTEQYDSDIRDFILPYQARVDSIYNRPVGYSAVEMSNKSVEMANFTADFGRDYGRAIVDSLRRVGATDLQGVDLSIMNRGGIRQPFHQGTITEGQVLSAYPFSNHIVLLQIKGSDLAEALQACANKGGEAISSEVRVIIDPDNRVQQILIGDSPLDPDRTYTVSTIDYLAWGNDYLDALKQGRIVWRDPLEMSTPMLHYIQQIWEQQRPIDPDSTPRFITNNTDNAL